VGLVLVAISGAIFGYYTSWILIVPILCSYDKKYQWLREFFPEVRMATLLPLLTLIFGLVSIGTLFGIALVKSRKHRALKKSD